MDSGAGIAGTFFTLITPNLPIQTHAGATVGHKSLSLPAIPDARFLPPPNHRRMSREDKAELARQLKQSGG